MADFGLDGIDYEVSGILNLSMISEYRGNSYVVGGDTGANTFPNFVKNYNTGVKEVLLYFAYCFLLWLQMWLVCVSDIILSNIHM